MNKHIHISTTSTIHGVDVEANIGFISSHVVAGTGIVSDIFASFSDFFGGRSNSYKKQLIAIKHEAIEELKDECKKLGGNGIVGLKIDLDEVSGKNMSMLMITASGTAVKVDGPLNSEHYISSELKYENISDEELKAWVYKAKVLQRANNKSLNVLDKNELDKIIEYRIFEVCDYFLKNFENSYESITDDRLSMFKLFFYSMPAEDASDKLYDGIIKYSKIADIIISTLDDLKLFNYEQISSLIHSDDLTERKIGLQLAMIKKLSYNKEDIKHHIELSEDILSAFYPLSEIYEVKKIMGTKKVWKCICDREVDQSEERCGACFLDRFGFSANELTPTKVSVHLKNNAVGMKMAFGV